MFTAIALFGWLMLLIAPTTPIGGALRRWSIERPAAWLNRITRGHLIIALVLLTMVCGAMWLKGDAPQLLAMGLPDFVGWAMMFDVSAMVDAAVAASLLAGSVRWSAVRARFSRRAPRARPRQPRRRRVAGARKPAANDDDGPRWARAA